MFNITNHQGNANQNHSEVPPHIFQKAIVKGQKITSVGEELEKREHSGTIRGNVH